MSFGYVLLTAVVVAALVGFWVYRSAVKAISAILSESGDAVTQKVVELGETVSKFDTRIATLEAFVAKDMVSGGSLYEAMVGDDDAVGDLYEIMPSFEEEEKANAEAEAEDNSGDSDPAATQPADRGDNGRVQPDGPGRDPGQTDRESD